MDWREPFALCAIFEETGQKTGVFLYMVFNLVVIHMHIMKNRAVSAPFDQAEHTDSPVYGR